MAIDLVPALLATGHKYRKELLAMPLLRLDPYLRHMTLRTGVRGDETVGTIGNNAELRPYKTAKGETDTTTLGLRTLTTYLGDVVEEFDPHMIASTIYGNAIARKPTEADIVKAVAMEMSKVAGNKLRKNIFKAARNANGTTTADLFNGFLTIIASEIVGGDLSVLNGNYKELPVITSANVVDVLKSLYFGSSEELQEENTKLFLPYNIYNLYQQAYLAEFGSVAYNTQYKQSFLVGSDDKCQLVPMSAMSGTNQLIITTQSNMLIGVDQVSDKETVRIRECDNPKVVQFFMKMYFGTQIESLENQRLMVGKIVTGA